MACDCCFFIKQNILTEWAGSTHISYLLTRDSSKILYLIFISNLIITQFSQKNRPYDSGIAWSLNLEILVRHALNSRFNRTKNIIYCWILSIALWRHQNISNTFGNNSNNVNNNWMTKTIRQLLNCRSWYWIEICYIFLMKKFNKNSSFRLDTFDLVNLQNCACCCCLSMRSLIFMYDTCSMYRIYK